MEDLNFRKGDAKTDVFGSDRMLQPSPVEKIPDGPTTPEVAYQMVKDETFAQTQPRLNLATFVTTYMDEYATKLMNEAININYIDETEYPRIAVMNGKCINIVANLWNSPEKDTWKTGALAIGSSEACMLGGVAAWLRWRKKRQAQGKPFDKPNFVISTGFQVVFVILENFCLCLIQRTLGELPNFGVMIWQLYYMLRSALICFQVTRFRNKGNHFI